MRCRRSDFSRLLAESEAEETAAKAAFDKLVPRWGGLRGDSPEGLVAGSPELDSVTSHAVRHRRQQKREHDAV